MFRSLIAFSSRKWNRLHTPQPSSLRWLVSMSIVFCELSGFACCRSTISSVLRSVSPQPENMSSVDMVLPRRADSSLAPACSRDSSDCISWVSIWSCQVKWIKRIGNVVSWRHSGQQALRVVQFTIHFSWKICPQVVAKMRPFSSDSQQMVQIMSMILLKSL
uniref:Uncharacterized protein n=1 Tax=Anopheles maculatus TaxID=74869 RepID=A0A182TC18_9DIPT